MAMSRDTARKALGAIRIGYGAAGLVAPELLLHGLGVATTTSQPATYPFRMFGIRTVLIGADLWLLRGPELRRATKLAVLIHGCDTLSAAVTTIRGDLPRTKGIVATAISAGNTVLALTAARA